jgi:predicted RNA methylase
MLLFLALAWHIVRNRVSSIALGVHGVKMKSDEGIRTFDLFCGGGGSSIGAKSAGAIPLGGVDLWPVATAAFEANIRGAKAYTSGHINHREEEHHT